MFFHTSDIPLWTCLRFSLEDPDHLVFFGTKGAEDIDDVSSVMTKTSVVLVNEILMLF